MMPWGHLGAGYLLYVWYSIYRPRLDPHGSAVIALIVGTQFPDLVDKPLAWTFSVLPSGRSLAHSLLTAALVIAVVLYVTNRIGRWYWGTAFSIGYLAHLVTDSLQPALAGQTALLTYLGWPILRPPAYGEESGVMAHFKSVGKDVSQGQLDFFFWSQIGLLLSAFAVAAYIEWNKRHDPSQKYSIGLE